MRFAISTEPLGDEEADIMKCRSSTELRFVQRAGMTAKSGDSRLTEVLRQLRRKILFL